MEVNAKIVKGQVNLIKKNWNNSKRILWVLCTRCEFPQSARLSDAEQAKPGQGWVCFGLSPDVVST
jgi:hypothetical protein